MVKKKGGGKKAAFGQLDEDEVPSVSLAVPSLDEAEKDDGEEEEEETLTFAGKKKGKKGKKDKKQSVDDYPELDPDAVGEDDDAMDFSGVKKKNNKKKGGAVKPSFSLLDEDEEDNEVASAVPSLDDAEKDEDDEEDTLMFAGKKKGKKGKKDKKQLADDYPVLNPDAEEEEVVDFSAAKKTSNKKKGGATKGGFSLLDEDEDNGEAALVSPAVPSVDDAEKVEDEEEETLMFAGKKKGKKGKKDKKQPVDDYPVLDPEAEAEEEVVDFSGAKKKSNKKKGAAKKSAFSLLDEDEDVSDNEVASVSPAVASVDETEKDDAEEEEETLMFAGKKKGKKGKKDKKASKDDEDIDALIGELEGHKISEAADAAPVPAAATAEPKGKQKKKGKKSGRTVQEEEDLDAILAELEGPAKPTPVPPAPETVAPASVSPAPVEAEEPSAEEKSSAAGVALPDAEEVAESAASKKKKKKKEKEKAAKAGAADKPAEEVVVEEKKAPVKVEESKGKGKAVPKHVREMQERLARMKEADEKRKQEEEEKRRKEEEEQRRLEELERQKEELKRKRKEREKEKLLQKKKEGKLLTGKKKEEARRLAIMREQFGITTDLDSPSPSPSPTGAEAAAPRKPKYETKKKRKPPGAGHTSEAAEEAEMPEPPAPEPEPEVEPEPEPEPQPEPEPAAAMEEEEEEEEDWDAKSFEEVNLPAIRSAFAEEEADDGPVKAGQVTVPPPSAPPAATKPSSPKKKPAPPPKSQQKVVETESEDEDEDDEDDESEDDADVKKRQQAKVRREARRAEALKKRSAEDLRSPICCILGHVDTGKTKLLDCIRRTNVQEGEAGGITQQIGATYFPMENIRERTKELRTDAKLRVPGLLVIDTPGHESFTNLRARGSSLCDIAILVIDIMHGLEPQTIESLNLLKARHTPFVVALNKVDRLYGWKTCPNAPIRNALKLQSKDVIGEFEQRVAQISTELKVQGLNSELYYKNKELRKFISVIPTSAISGEGVPDILMLLVQLTQKLMEDKLMYISEVQATVLEVKVVEGLGTTIDVVLVNGVLHEGDKIVVCGMQGPIVTSIRALLTPHPMKELRVKGSYQHHKELRAAQGIKITAQGLEHAIAGTQLYVIGPEDDEEDIKDEAMQDIRNVMSRIDKSGEGVCVQASTLGSLEALLEFLKSPAVKIPVSGISIGPVHKKDVMRASVMLERKRKEFATILAFDVKVTTEAKELAEEVGVRIFTADIIYHLFDQFTAYMNSVKEEKRKDASEEAVFPCVLKIMPQCVFNKKDPIVVGVDVLDGVAKVGTPICIPSRDGIDIGKIASMEINHKVVDTAKKGQTVAMKIVGTNPEENSRMFGRHFDIDDELVSRITRRSIDLLKENYRDDLTTDEWRLVVKLKKLFEIP